VPPPLVSRLVADDSGLTIDYELTLDDLVGWSETMHRTNKTAREGKRAAWVLFGLATAMILLVSMISEPINYPLAAIGIVFGLLTVGGWPLLYRWRIRRQIHRFYADRQNYNVVGPRRVIITPEFVTYSSPVSQTVMRWVGLERIITDPHALYILVAVTSAVIVPRRAFASDADFARFVATAHEFHSRAGSMRAQ